MSAESLNNALAIRSVGPAASQATTVEQSRAVAEVQAMVVVAQSRPRDETLAIEQMRQACRRIQMANRAFYKFPRGGQTVQGATVHLARELARCWGNINYGVTELDRNDAAGQSEMVAYAWDVQTNARSATSFIVPHKRDKKGGSENLLDLRDIYENNANNAARRLREMIFSVLPRWYVDEAMAICRVTLEKGENETPLPSRIATTIQWFGEMGISRERLEAKVGAKSGAWTPVDLANLGISYQSLKNKEITPDEEFPQISASTLVSALQSTVADPEAKPAQDEAAVEAEAKLEKIIQQMGTMATEADLEGFHALVEDDLVGLSDQQRGRFNTAKLERLKAIQKKGGKK
jgi:hypothetical protein